MMYLHCISTYGITPKSFTPVQQPLKDMGESHDEKSSVVTLLSNVVVNSAVSTTNRPGEYGVGSVQISRQKQGESGIRRLANSAEQLVQRPLEGINTVYDVVVYAPLKYGDREALGWREVIKTIEEEREIIKTGDQTDVVEKKQWKYFELSEYKWMSYNQVKEAVSEISRGLIKHGVSKGDVFNIYALTRYVISSSDPHSQMTSPLDPTGNSYLKVAHPFPSPLPPRTMPLMKVASFSPLTNRIALVCSPMLNSFLPCFLCYRKLLPSSLLSTMANPSASSSKILPPSVTLK